MNVISKAVPVARLYQNNYYRSVILKSHFEGQVGENLDNEVDRARYLKNEVQLHVSVCYCRTGAA